MMKVSKFKENSIVYYSTLYINDSFKYKKLRDVKIILLVH